MTANKTTFSNNNDQRSALDEEGGVSSNNELQPIRSTTTVQSNHQDESNIIAGHARCDVGEENIHRDENDSLLMRKRVIDTFVLDGEDDDSDGIVLGNDEKPVPEQAQHRQHQYRVPTSSSTAVHFNDNNPSAMMRKRIMENFVVDDGDDATEISPSVENNTKIRCNGNNEETNKT